MASKQCSFHSSVHVPLFYLIPDFSRILIWSKVLKMNVSGQKKKKNPTFTETFLGRKLHQQREFFGRTQDSDLTFVF